MCSVSHETLGFVDFIQTHHYGYPRFTVYFCKIMVECVCVVIIAFADGDDFTHGCVLCVCQMNTDM